MKVGDLVRVRLPSVKPYTGIVIKYGTGLDNGSVLVRSLDARFEYWINSWSGQVISASR